MNDVDVFGQLQLWSDQTPLTFTRTEGVADIDILFAEGEHGDGAPFDGLGDTLAHASYPTDPFPGDTHFDNAEQWTAGNDTGTGKRRSTANQVNFRDDVICIRKLILSES
jgi:hypothetical protein